MPEIKQFTRTAMPQELVNVQADARAFGSDQSALKAQARTQLESAQLLSDSAGKLDTMRLKHDESDYFAKISEFELDNMRRQKELGESDFEDGADMSSVYAADLEERASKLQIPNSMKDKYQRDLANMKVNFAGAGMKEQSRRVGVQAKVNLDNTTTNAVNMVAADPSKYDTAAELLEGQINALTHIAGVEKTAILEGSLDKLREARAGANAAGNPWQFKKDAKAGLYKDTPQLAQYMRTADAKIKQSQAKVDSAIRSEVNHVSDLRRAGVRVDDSKLARLQKEATANGLTETSSTIQIMRATADDADHFVNDLTLAGQGEFLAKAQASLHESHSKEDLARYKSLTLLYDDKIKRLNADALGYYESTKVVPPSQPLDLSDPASFGDEIDNRRLSRDIINARDGVTIPLLRGAEINQIAHVYENGKPKEVAKMLETLSGTFSVNERRSISQQVSKNSEEMAVAMTVSPQVAKTLLNGAATQGDVSADKVRAATQKLIGGTIVQGEQLEGIYRAVHNMYKGEALASGNTVAGVVDQAILKKAIKDVVGPTENVNNHKVFSFVKDDGEWASGGELRRAMASLTETNMPQVSNGMPIGSQDGLTVEPDEIRRLGRFVNSGGSKYMVYIGGEHLINRNGGAFEIDAKLLDALAPARSNYNHKNGYWLR